MSKKQNKTTNNQQKNQDGKRAEEIFGVRITQDYFFRARDLGEKWPVSDYYVEVENNDEPLYFIVQVKSSTRGYDTKKNLKIAVTKKKVNQLASYQAPTYVAGVDVEKEVVYLTPLYKKKNTGISKISDKFTLSKEDKSTSKKNLNKLLQEIKQFWMATNTKTIKRNFKSTL
jgi:hypothetical protein